MKAKLRNITVEDIQYKWLIDFNKAGDGSTKLRVFEQPSKTCIIDKTIGSDLLPVTPGLVSNMILEMNHGCETGNHDIVPLMGFGNSIIGDQCRQCGKKL